MARRANSGEPLLGRGSGRRVIGGADCLAFSLPAHHTGNAHRSPGAFLAAFRLQRQHGPRRARPACEPTGQPHRRRPPLLCCRRSQRGPGVHWPARVGSFRSRGGLSQPMPSAPVSRRGIHGSILGHKGAGTRCVDRRARNHDESPTRARCRCRARLGGAVRGCRPLLSTWRCLQPVGLCQYLHSRPLLFVGLLARLLSLSSR
mmetsp:Transcript_12043/g.39561  ORF Transcript_12043/g.39561 Transcript_12043/m.39561 type:complete len:203 (+) Transcript_12043:757-1365(+)